MYVCIKDHHFVKSKILIKTVYNITFITKRNFSINCDCLFSLVLSLSLSTKYTCCMHMEFISLLGMDMV